AEQAQPPIAALVAGHVGTCRSCSGAGHQRGEEKGAVAAAAVTDRSPARSAGRSHMKTSAPSSRASVTWPNAIPHPSTLAPPKRPITLATVAGASGVHAPGVRAAANVRKVTTHPRSADISQVCTQYATE